MSEAVVRDELGKVTAGHANLNPTGKNQTTSPRHIVRHVLNAAVLRELAMRPEEIENWGRAVVNAIGSPLQRGHPELLRQGLGLGVERDVAGDGGGEQGDASTSEGALLQLAESFDTGAPPDLGSDQGAPSTGGNGAT